MDDIDKILVSEGDLVYVEVIQISEEVGWFLGLCVYAYTILWCMSGNCRKLGFGQSFASGAMAENLVNLYDMHLCYKI